MSLSPSFSVWLHTAYAASDMLNAARVATANPEHNHEEALRMPKAKSCPHRVWISQLLADSSSLGFCAHSLDNH